MRAFYAASADAVAMRLAGGTDVALLCEGDPFLYGSAMLFLSIRKPRDKAAVEAPPAVTAPPALVSG